MKTAQDNKLTMLQTVLTYLAGDGAGLAALKRIGAAMGLLAGLVKKIVDAGQAQQTPTTGVTGTREEVKAEATAKGEVLRLLVVTCTLDNTLRKKLGTPTIEMAHGKGQDFVDYLTAIAAGVSTLAPDDLDPTETGYDPKVLTTLNKDIEALNKTQGAARQIQIGTSGATDVLPGLFQEVDVLLEKTLDPLVNAQKLNEKLAGQVADYKKARRIVHTAARRRPRFSGHAAPGAVVLVLDRHTAALVNPVLGNKSGKGRSLRYYTSATSTGRPLPGDGLVVANRAEVHLDNYDKLGPDPEARYLMVALEGVDGEGHWVVS